MLSNRLAFAGLALACVAAAAAGGYFAARQTVVPTATEASAPAARGQSEAATSTVGVARFAEAAEPNRTSTPVSPASASLSTASVKSGEATSRAGSRAPSVATSSRRPNTAGPTKSDLPLPERQWPAGSAVNPAPTSTANATFPAPVEVSAAPRVDDRASQEPPRPPEPAQKSFEELVVVADSVIGLQAQSTVTSDQARVEDRVEARVSRDVRVHDMIAIPAGSRALGTVVSVERGGKFKERARLGIRFNTLVLADGTRMPISTDTIYREGTAPGKDSTAKMTGAAVGGAILGAIIGGGKGAAIGGAVGAGAGAAATAAGDRSQAALYSGEPITVRLLAPVTVTIEQK